MNGPACRSCNQRAIGGDACGIPAQGINRYAASRVNRNRHQTRATTQVAQCIAFDQQGVFQGSDALSCAQADGSGRIDIGNWPADCVNGIAICDRTTCSDGHRIGRRNLTQSDIARGRCQTHTANSCDLGSRAHVDIAVISDKRNHIASERGQ